MPEEERALPHPRYEPGPTEAAGPIKEPLPRRERPPDGPVPRMSGGVPSLVDEPPDEESGLGKAKFRENAEME